MDIWWTQMDAQHPCAPVVYSELRVRTTEPAAVWWWHGGKFCCSEALGRGLCLPLHPRLHMTVLWGI